ncbi:NADP-dependent oxidoreductase [Isoptericola sp. NPDC058082]|uniref:NADP-dependent oxidoreductase n=1 Tax=Isoptericola sp. NPDC058082 TaxID=3346331 RepID=UPI0036EB4131
MLRRYGHPGVMELREVPRPVAGPGEVLVRVRAAGLNPIDFKTRDGGLRVITRLRLPLVAGSELAGEVAAVGAGVTRFAVGDRVHARVDKRRLGAFAPYAAVHESLVAAMPASIGFVEAASLPLAGLTALQALRDELKVAPGDRVLVTGGAGGVGTLAIQLAVWLGAEVTTTASARGAALVRSLGAARVVDYRAERFADVLHDYDGVLDLTGGQDLTDAFTILRPGRTVVSVAGLPDATTARVDLDAGPLKAALLWAASTAIRRRARHAGVRYRYLFMHPSGADLATLADLVDGGHVRPVVDRTFPFADIARAFAYLERGRAKGKVVVEL